MGCGIVRTINDNEDIYLNRPIMPIYRVLNNKLKCPLIGLGTALIKTNEDMNIVYQSIVDGVRL